MIVRHQFIRVSLAVAALATVSCGETLAPPPELEPVVFEVYAAELWTAEVGAAVAAMRRQVRSAGGIAGRPVVFRVTIPPSVADVIPDLNELAERVEAEPPAALIGPVNQSFFASLLLDSAETTQTPMIFPFPRDELAYQLLPDTTTTVTFAPPPPPLDGVRERTSCSKVLLLSTPNGVGVFEPSLRAAFEPDIPVEVISSTSASVELADRVVETAADCVWLNLTTLENPEFLRIWGQNDYPTVQWMGTHSLRTASEGLDDVAFLEGAVVVSPIYTDARRSETQEFLSYLETIDDSLTRSQQDLAAGVYDALALAVLATEYRLVTDPNVAPIAAVQLVSTESIDGFDEASPAKMADGLELARSASVNYQGALGALDIDPVDRFPDRPYGLLVLTGGEFQFEGAIR